jgi:serine/threonine protein kinase
MTPDALELLRLVPGSRWRGVYQIGEQLPDVTYGKVFKAMHVGVMNDVLIRSFKVSDDLRERAWKGICQAQNGVLLKPLEAITGDGRRIEVTQAVPTLTLREWAGRTKASQPEIQLIVRQLSEALGSLHKQGVVHLNVRSDTIYVRATEGGLSLTLGGLETAAILNADVPVELSLDPFYAPPEAVGLYHFRRELGLRAWDWWSLGRVLQEVVLGRHILGHMLERDVTRETPELRARAENLLKEQDANTRAGAVEMMPAMDRDLATLLRGLLTGSRDGRWGLAEVESWLRKEPVKDRYNLPRHERLFFWKDRAYAVAEAASFFARAEHWQEGVTNLLEPSNTATLAYFLGTENAHKKTKERFDVLIKLGETPALQKLPPEIVSNVVVAVALKFLAGHDAPLLLRGNRVDENCLRQLLRPEGQPEGLNTVYAFTARPIVQQIEQFDSELGRMLSDLDRLFEAALALAKPNHWLAVDSDVQMATLMGLCLEPEMAVSATRTAMVKQFACSRDRALDVLFKKREASQAELVVVAFTLREPGKYLYVTHQAWNSEQYRVLSERADQLVAAALWLQLGHALRLGPLVFGRLRLIVPFWCAIALIVGAVGQNRFSYLVAGVCPVLPLVVRFIWFGFHRMKLHHRLQGNRPWTLCSGWSRCREEALAVLKADSVPGPKALLRMLKETNEEIGKLTLDSAPEPIPFPAKFTDTQTVGVASWILLLVLSAGTVVYGVRHPPKMPTLTWDRITRLWSSADGTSGAVKEAPARAKLTADQVPTTGVKSIQASLDELRRAKREAAKQPEPLVKISWPFKMPVSAKPIRVQESAIALPEQIAVAEEMAQLLLDHYEPTTINATIAVQVPVEKGVGLMLYDGRTGKISDRKVYTVAYLPFSRSWIEVDSKTAIFLSGQ